MRRRRHVIQVTTFPFLAVLLCTMGSLILLLLVIDKRAKAVARAKAAQEHADRRKSTVEDEKAKQEEWERQLRNLHALLRSQLDDIQGKSDAVHGQMNATVAELSSTQNKQRDLKGRLAVEKESYARTANAFAARKSELAQSDRQNAETEAQRRQMTADVALLEKTLEELKAAKRLEAQTFSLVPYKGRRGENRKPLYLECTADGWVFHPDHKSLPAAHDAGADLHAEIERRLKASAEASAYVFLLVRPDGITNYYHALSAMRGLEVAYGYEFVDAAWVLDFSGNPDGPAQPWKNDGPGPGAIASSSNPAVRGSVQAVDQPWIFRKGLGASNATTGGTGLPNSSTGATPGGPRTQNVQVARGVMSPGSDYEDTGHSVRGSMGLRSGGTAGGNGEATGASAIRIGIPGGGFGKVDADAGFGPEGVLAGGPEPRGIGQGGVKPTPVGDDLPSLTPGNTSGHPQAGNFARSGDPSSRPTAGPEGNSPRNGQVPYPGESPAKPSAGSPGYQGKPGSSPARNGDTAKGGGENPSARETANGGGNAEGADDRAAGGLDGPSFPRLPRRGSNGGSGDKPKPFHLTGNRDWLIPLVCTPDAIVLPSGVKIAASVVNTSDGAKALTKAVQDIIARKQTTVRDGEPPYRPQIRFLVHSEGLRLYHQAYPILESLQVPILRQNIEPEDANPSGTGVH
jgi:hypothetical protein